MHEEKIEVCCGSNCTARGAENILDTLDKKFENVHMCNCLGFCKKGPNVLVDEKRIIHYSKSRTIVDKIKNGEGERFNRPDEDEIFDILNEI